MTRQLQLILLVIAIAIVFVLLFPGRLPSGADLLTRLRGRPSSQCPDFTSVVPSTWAIQSVVEINPGDNVGNVCLVIYRYDQIDRGPMGSLGGVVYHREPDRFPANLATPRPFRPGSLIPYPLLPRPGGLGFLGESRVNTEVYNADGTGKQDIVVTGYSGYGDIITYLSIFQWRSDTEGYRVMSSPDGGVLYGDAGIEVIPGPTPTPLPGPTPTPRPRPDPPIERVIVRTHLWEPFYYARSRFARRIDYVWSGPPDTRTLRPISRSLDFAYLRTNTDPNYRPAHLRPGQPTYSVWYPEEAVLAYYPPGRVRDIILPASGELDTTVNVVAEIVDDQGRIKQVTWQATQRSINGVKQMTEWELKQITP